MCVQQTFIQQHLNISHHIYIQSVFHIIIIKFTLFLYGIIL